MRKLVHEEVDREIANKSVNIAIKMLKPELDQLMKKNAQLIEDAFYKKENLNPDMKRPDTGKKKIEVPDGIDAEALMKVLNNPEMAALLAGLAKGVTV